MRFSFNVTGSRNISLNRDKIGLAITCPQRGSSIYDDLSRRRDKLLKDQLIPRMPNFPSNQKDFIDQKSVAKEHYIKI